MSSPNGTIVAWLLQHITDTDGATWTINLAKEILRNGVPVGSDRGTLLTWRDGRVYMLGVDSQWRGWTGTTWELFADPTPSVIKIPVGEGWWQWSGRTWKIVSNIGVFDAPPPPPPPPPPDPTTTDILLSITDATGGIWTLGSSGVPSGFPTLRDGVQMGELRQCVADEFVRAAERHLAAGDMEHGHPAGRRGAHDSQQFAAVASDNE